MGTYLNTKFCHCRHSLFYMKIESFFPRLILINFTRIKSASWERTIWKMDLKETISIRQTSPRSAWPTDTRRCATSSASSLMQWSLNPCIPTLSKGELIFDSIQAWCTLSLFNFILQKVPLGDCEGIKFNKTDTESIILSCLQINNRWIS